MDIRELFEEPEENTRALWAGLQKHMFSSLVCIVTKDSDGKTVQCQPAIKRTVSDKTYDQTSYEDFPLLDDVPVHFPSGGGVTHTFPIKKDDEILVIFTSRPHDTWFQSGGTQQQIYNRMHHLSDGIAIPGIKSQPRALNPAPSTVSAQTRSDDGKHFVELHPTDGVTLSVNNAAHVIKVHNTNGISLTSSQAIVHNAPSITYTSSGGNLA